jgi:AcrR family transcriptional regulator
VVSSTGEQTSNRGARRRERTRARLIEAARTLFADRGVESTRINEITEEADVGFGSFYNHFASKEAIVAAVFEQDAAAQGAAVEVLTAELDDPAEVVAVAHRHFAAMARRDPTTAWLLVHLEFSHGILRTALFPYAMRDLQRGIDAGRFTVADPEIALIATAGALLGIIRALLDGAPLPPDAEIRHAELVLRTLGLEAEDAAEVARRPLPVT